MAETEVASAERIVLTGDIAAGPQPVEVLDRLLDLGDRVSWVRGNADRELVELARGASTDPITSWAATQLCVDHLDWLAQIPAPHCFEHRRLRRCRVLPRHTPRRQRGRPRRHPLGPLGRGAGRTTFDPNHASVIICRQSSYPDIAAWTDYFLHARASDVDAIVTFGPGDGR